VRRSISAAGCAALVAALLVSVAVPAGAVPEPSVDEPVVDCSATTADQTWATTIAVACGHDVEVVADRTEWNTVYAQPDGSMRLDVSALAVRTQVDGGWGDIDTRVVAAEAGLTVAAPVRPMVFSDGSDGMPLARIERDGHELTFDAPFPLPAPTTEGDQITYDEVLPGVDLVVSVNDDATGFSEVLRVETPEAAADPRLAQLSFPVEISSGLELREDGGGFLAVDAAGEQMFTSPVPVMWDSRQELDAPTFRASAGALVLAAPAFGPDDAVGADPVDLDREPSLDSQRSVMPASVAQDAVSITPDPAMLSDEETVWPVYIDPAISGSLNDWTAVRNVFGQSYRFGTDEGVGLCDRAVSSSCSATFSSRVLYKFGGLAAIGAMEPGHITGATFAAVGTHSYDCTPREVTAYRVDNWDSSTPWPGSAHWIPQSTLVAATKSTCAGSPVRWLEFSALEAGRAVATSNANQLAMGIAVNEANMAWWKRFRNDAGLSISYNRPPNLPTGVKFTSPGGFPCVTGSGRPAARSTAPVLYAVLSDPDGEAVQANVDVYKAGTSTPILWHARPAAQASGVGQSVRLGGMANKGIYRVQINGVDPSVTGGSAVACEVEIDTDAPLPPKVTPTPVGTQPVYETGTPAGGIGMKGSFTFTNGGSTDVVSYKYSINSSALNLSTASTAPTVAFTPTLTGSQTLYFQSVDRAGNTSTMQTYTFTVAWPTQTLWSLDETSGTKAASQSPSDDVSPLTLTGTPTRVDGPLAETGFDPNDRALLLAGNVAAGTAAQVPVQTAQNFAVSALVRADSTTGAASVLSQDGASAGAFDLGYRACASGPGSCWSFAMNRTDVAAPTADAAVSTTPVEVGKWMFVAGVHDAGADRLSLYVCQVGEQSIAPEDPVTATHAEAWSGTGPFRLGGSRSAGIAPWIGAVSEVRSWTGVVDVDAVRRACTPTGTL
jgi:hypothetical protein